MNRGTADPVWNIRLSHGTIDRCCHQFTLTVTDGAGATANATVTTLLGRATLSCTNPIASVQVSPDGPSWIMDSLAF